MQRLRFAPAYDLEMCFLADKLSVTILHGGLLSRASMVGKPDSLGFAGKPPLFLTSNYARDTAAAQGVAVMTEKKKLAEVFKTVGLPRYTYVKPTYYGEVKADISQPGKHLLIEGPSGIGKTCVAFKVFEELTRLRLRPTRCRVAH